MKASLAIFRETLPSFQGWNKLFASQRNAIIWPNADWKNWIPTNAYLLPAATIAVISNVETLLCATAIDKMHRQARFRTNNDWKLAAQGVGKFLACLLGGLSMAGVIVGSSANAEARNTLLDSAGCCKEMDGFLRGRLSLTAHVHFHGQPGGSAGLHRHQTGQCEGHYGLRKLKE